MQTIQQTFSPAFAPASTKQSLFSRFIAWCDSQEPYRFGWLAVILAIHGCVLAPVTVMSIAMGGNHFAFWGITIGAMAIALIPNLAALPTRITIPAFFLSILLDVAVIAGSFISLL